jgi:hypothetical protein
VQQLLEKTHDRSPPQQGGVIYFHRADILLTVTEVRRRTVAHTGPPRLIAKMDDRDLRTAFFDDPDSHTLAVCDAGIPEGQYAVRKLTLNACATSLNALAHRAKRTVKSARHPSGFNRNARIPPVRAG